MKDWEWGLMKGKRKDKPLVALNETVVFEKSSYIYILYKLSRYYSSMRMSVHDHSYL
ncbi:unnamed protein product [Camellia sinensis]